MTDEAKALVERLKGHSEIMERDKGKFVRFIDVATCTEAVDLIEELDRHLTLSGKVSKAPSDRIETLETQLESANEALRERLRGALEREPKAWLIADEETAWVTLFEPNPKDHPWGDVIPLYSAALAGEQ